MSKIVGASNAIKAVNNTAVLGSLYIASIPAKISIINTVTTIKLLRKLSNILNLDKLFNGFNFLTLSFTIIIFVIHLAICQSPLIHLCPLAI